MRKRAAHSPMVKAIRLHATGGPEVLRYEDLDPGSPGAGAVLVRHSAIGVNYVDVGQRAGLYPLALPAVLGKEASGIVEAVGSGVTEVRPGDRVAYAGGPPGSYAEARVVAVDRLVKLPDGISERQAAGVLLKGLTAWYLLRRAYRVRGGETVLLHAAAGGVGLIALQWLKALGVTVIGTVGSTEKAELVRAHGCDHVVVYTREDFVKRVREITQGAGVPVVYDGVGRATFEDSLTCLAPLGTMVNFGDASGTPLPLDLAKLAPGSLTVTRPTLGAHVATRRELLTGASEVFGMIERGALRVIVGRTYRLREAAGAHRALEQRETVGSLLLIP